MVTVTACVCSFLSFQWKRSDYSNISCSVFSQILQRVNKCTQLCHITNTFSCRNWGPVRMPFLWYPMAQPVLIEDKPILQKHHTSADSHFWDRIIDLIILLVRFLKFVVFPVVKFMLWKKRGREILCTSIVMRLQSSSSGF